MKRSLLVLVCLALSTPASAFRNYTMPSTSMLPTLDVGDIVTAALYGVDYAALATGTAKPGEESRDPQFQPQRGDVAFFKVADGTDYVKRIVGLPGDRVQMRGGFLFLNGVPLLTETVEPVEGACPSGTSCTFIRETLPEGRSYVVIDMQDGSPGDDTPEFLVPANCYFTMGDNRDNSFDSRFMDIGPVGYVPREAIVGKLHFVLSSDLPASGQDRIDGFPHLRAITPTPPAALARPGGPVP